MNIDYMKYNNLEIKSLKQEIVDLSSLIKNVQDHGCTISDETFDKLPFLCSRVTKQNQSS